LIKQNYGKFRVDSLVIDTIINKGEDGDKKLTLKGVNHLLEAQENEKKI